MNEADYPVAQFKKNASEEVRVSIGEFQGHKLINMRVYFRSATGGMAPKQEGARPGHRPLSRACRRGAKGGSGIAGPGILKSADEVIGERNNRNPRSPDF